MVWASWNSIFIWYWGWGELFTLRTNKFPAKQKWAESSVCTGAKLLVGRGSSLAEPPAAPVLAPLHAVGELLLVDPASFASMISGRQCIIRNRSEKFESPESPVSNTHRPIVHPQNILYRRLSSSFCQMTWNQCVNSLFKLSKTNLPTEWYIKRIGLASGAMNALHPVWELKHISNRTKIALWSSDYEVIISSRWWTR